MARMIVAMVPLLLSGAVAAPAADWIDLASDWLFRPDPQNVGLCEGWHTPPYADGEWATIQAGTRWEDQGFPDVDGTAWYRRFVDVPADWQDKNVWLVLGAVNDSCTVFCNGQRLGSYGDDKERSVHATPLIAELSASLRCGESNLIVIQCCDWGASGGLWRLPCALTADAARLPIESLVACSVEPEPGRIIVHADLAGLGNDRPDTSLHVAVTSRSNLAEPVQDVLPLAPGAMQASVPVAIPDAAPGMLYRVHATVRDAQGEAFQGVEAIVDVAWPSAPGWPGDYGTLEVRNNFVTELLDVQSHGGTTNYAFANPRDGWVFFSLSSEGLRVFLDAAARPLVWRSNPATGADEAMTELSQGTHRIRVAGAAPARIEIRTMPEIACCYYPTSPHIAAFGPYGWDYMERHILPHVNTLITRSAVPAGEFEAWGNEGRQWVSNASLPGLSDPQAPEADAVYEVWANNPGVEAPGFGGLIVDEFLWAGAGHYGAWGDAVRRLHESPAFRGRTFYAWCGDLYGLPAPLEFSQLLAGLGHRFSWERYLPEPPNEDAARRLLFQELQHKFVQWQEAMPGIERHMVLCLGYLSAPPETLNLNPGVDYHVFLDMQFRLLATDPAFFGIHGVMEYMADYADEESMRWAHRLFRHYCIEGNRAPLTKDPYLLNHIANPDFANVFDGWQVEAAEADGVAVKRMEGFSWLQGRYPKTSEGDQFCWMKRSEKGPNRIRQRVVSLEAGRTYSVKLISAVFDQLDKKQATQLAIEIAGGERLDEYGFAFTYPSCYSHEQGPYTRQSPAHFTFHRVVFRAEAATAELAIADLAGPDKPGSTLGQETAFNFVEVQPFHEP